MRSSRSWTTPPAGRRWSTAPGDLPDRAAVAIYRFERDGWTPEDVASELERQTYHYGLVPGYIYAMVKTKPLASLLKADMLVDRNRAGGIPQEPAEKPLDFTTE